MLRACVESPDASLRRELNAFILAVFARHPAAVANASAHASAHASARAGARGRGSAGDERRTTLRCTARAELYLLELNAVLNAALEARCAAHSRPGAGRAGSKAVRGGAAKTPCFSYPTRAAATEHVLHLIESVVAACPEFFAPHRAAVLGLTRQVARAELSRASARAPSSLALACGVRLLTAHVERSVAAADGAHRSPRADLVVVVCALLELASSSELLGVALRAAAALAAAPGTSFETQLLLVSRLAPLPRCQIWRGDAALEPLVFNLAASVLNRVGDGAGGVPDAPSAVSR